VTNGINPYELRVTGPAQRQLERLPERVAHAIVSFLVTALVEDPHRVGGELRRELEGLRSARRGTYRVIYEILDDDHAVVVLRIDHRSTAYRSQP
jgi:mRNA-degrading endonuclease RelE of RelBE toxin-antitoxin system